MGTACRDYDIQVTPRRLAPSETSGSHKRGRFRNESAGEWPAVWVFSALKAQLSETRLQMS